MIIKVNDEVLFELSETQKNVIKHDIPSEEFDVDMKRRLEYILTHKYEQCFARLKKEWEPKLAAKGITEIPIDKDAFAALVFSQPEYKDKSAQILESQLK